MVKKKLKQQIKQYRLCLFIIPKLCTLAVVFCNVYFASQASEADDAGGSEEDGRTGTTVAAQASEAGDAGGSEEDGRTGTTVAAQASEAGDAGGSEEDGRTGTMVAASATPPASAAHLYPGSVSAQQPHSQLQSEHPEQYHQENIPRPSAPVTSTSSDNDETEAASAFAGNPVLGHSSSQNAPVPGPSVSQSQNTSMDDFQTPVLHRPAAASVILAAASSNESIVEFRSPKRRRIMSPVKAKSSDKGEGKLTEADDNGGDDDGNVRGMVWLNLLWIGVPSLRISQSDKFCTWKFTLFKLEKNTKKNPPKW